MDGNLDQQGSSATPVGDNLACIRVKTLTDKESLIKINLNENVSSLRDLIHREMGIPAEDQKIIFQGKVLSSSRTLSSYGISDGFTVHMVDRPLSSTQSSSAATQQPHHHSLPTASQTNHTPSPHDHENRPSPLTSLMPRLNNMSLEQQSTNAERSTNRSPHINWRFFVGDSEITTTQNTLEELVTNVINNISYLPAEKKNEFRLEWLSEHELKIHLPYMSPHVASPALERLFLLVTYTKTVQTFVDIAMESDGLVTIVRNVIELARRECMEDNLSIQQRHDLFERLTAIAIRLSSIDTTLPLARHLDNEVVRRSTPAERNARFEMIDESNLNPECTMRHVVDSDLTRVIRELRSQQRRLIDFDELMDDIIETQAIAFVKNHYNTRDYRYAALSIYISQLQSIRHTMSHAIHISSEIEVPFSSNVRPNRLLPQYDLRKFKIPRPHTGSLVIVIRPPSNRQTENVQISSIFTPPRVRTDVQCCQPGEWPFLTFYPTGILQEQHELTMPLLSLNISMDEVDDANADMNDSQDQNDDGNELDATIEGDNGINIQTANFLQTAMSPFFNMTNNRRDANSTDPTRPNIHQMTERLDRENSGERSTANELIDGRGPENRLLQPFPVRLQPNELYEIAKNVASRFRDEAILRIASTLTETFRQQEPSWDLRLDRAPLSVLREMITMCLQLFTMSASTIDESRTMMTEILNNEDSFVRCIQQSLRTLFVHGEFPERISNVLSPREVLATSLIDYEDADAENNRGIVPEVVRLPSDVSQPMTGSLRDLARLRARERQRRQRQSDGSSPDVEIVGVNRLQPDAVVADTARRPQQDDTYNRIAARIEQARRELAPQLNQNEDSLPTRVTRRMISVDPFLNCTSRYNEMSRTSRLTGGESDIDRMTAASMDPNLQWSEYMRTLTIPSRSRETVASDPEFTYNVDRYTSGEIVIENSENGRETFEKVLKTALRSLFANLVETDSIIALNTLPFRGLGPSMVSLQEMVNQQMGTPRILRRPSMLPIPLPIFGQNIRAAAAHVNRPGETPPHHHSIPLNNEYNCISRLLGYLRESPLPQNFVGLFIDLLRGASTRTSFGHFNDYLGDSQARVRQILIDNQLNGNSNPSNEDLEAVSARLAGSLDHFESLFDSIEQNFRTVMINNRRYRTSTVLNYIDVAAIRQLLSIIMQRPDRETYINNIKQLIDVYGTRIYALLYCLFDRDLPRAVFWFKEWFPSFIRRRVFGQTNAGQDFADNILMLISICRTKFNTDSPSRFVEFIESVNQSSSSSPPINRDRTGNGEPVDGESSAKRRKCEQMEVDQAEEASSSEINHDDEVD